MTASTCNITTVPPTRLTDLPPDVLSQIALFLAHNPDKHLLPFAEASPTFHEPVLSALDNALIQTSASSPRRWTPIAHAHVRRLTLHTPVPTDPPLFSAYGLLSAPHLHTLSTRADAFTLSLITRIPNLRSLSLHLRRAALHPTVLHTVALLPQLTTLHLSYARDLTQLRLPPAHRCACAPLRAQPDDLSRAAPSVTDFDLTCTCAAATACTVPSFPNLTHLSLSGLLPADSPPELLAISKKLHSLSLESTIPPLQLATALQCTTVVAGTATLGNSAFTPGRLTSSDVRHLSQACPRLSTLRASITGDAVRTCLTLCTLVELDVRLPMCKSGSLSTPRATPLGPGTLSMLTTRLPQLRVLRLRGAVTPITEVGVVLRDMRNLHELTLSPHGQHEWMDLWLRGVLFALHGSVGLKVLEIERVDSDTLRAYAKDMGPVDGQRRIQLGKAPRRLYERRPLLKVRGVREIVDGLVAAPLRPVGATGIVQDLEDGGSEGPAGADDGAMEVDVEAWYDDLF